jgi:hypothetical protein
MYIVLGSYAGISALYVALNVFICISDLEQHFGGIVDLYTTAFM